MALTSLEDKLRPPYLARPWPRDLWGLGMLLAMGAVLLPAWSFEPARYLPDVPGQMASFHLLPATGFLLALRVGAIDLSVWAAAGLGGLVAAGTINAGLPAGAALLAGAAGGGLLGAINAAMTAGLRLPAPVVTLLSAAAVLMGSRAVAGAGPVAVSDRTFESWTLVEGMSPGLTGTLAVAAAYSMVMLALLAADVARAGRLCLSPRARLACALCASGALSGLAGGLWLIKFPAAPVPSRLVDDLRIPAAALLAGGALFGGRGRTLLAGVCLPPALLLTTIWRTEGWTLTAFGYDLQVVLLGGMCLMAQLAMREATVPRPGRRGLAAAAALLTAGGTVVLASSAAAEDPASRGLRQMTGLALWFAGSALLLADRARSRRGAPGAP